jgi:hypothetical protein
LKTGYVTDDFSTLGGLAAVSYGDPEYFREVQNQIYSQSPTKFLNTQRPSDIFESFFGTKEYFMGIVLDALETQYSDNIDFTNYIDINLGADWRKEVISRLRRSFFETLDSVEKYGLSLSDYVGLAVRNSLPNLTDSDAITAAVTSRVFEEPKVGTDARLIARAVSNNPQNKISVPPSGARIDLESSVDLGSDYRGVQFASGYISPRDYWNNVAFPGLTNSSVPTDLLDSVNSGYVGYLSSTPLEALYNPIGALTVSEGAGSVPASSILSQFPDNLQADRDVYAISLMGEKFNGFTTFDPATMSNGDLIDISLVPTFEEDNKDSQGGLNPAARNFTTAF